MPISKTAGRQPVRSLYAAGIFASLLAADSARAQMTAPVSPTVPTPTVTVHRPRVAQLHSGAVHAGQPGDKEGEGDKNHLPEFTLGQCIGLALERHPGLRTVKASQDATHAGQSALDNIGRLGAIFSRDLPIRKEQSSRGTIAAAAVIQKTHNEIVQDVTRLYYTVVYAHQQAQIAEDVVAQLETLVEVAKRLLNSKDPKGMTVSKLEVMQIGLSDVRAMLATAQAGEARAYAGLRMLMNVQDGSHPFRVKDKELPIMKQEVPLKQERVVELALCNRPELALAAAAADAFRLEVYAQAKIPFRRAVPTLASGSDIHSALLPPGNRDPEQEYRPEPIAPEMPPQVVGSQADRVNRVKAYSQRADGVYEHTRNLVVLEAENAFQYFELSRSRLGFGKKKFEDGRNLMEHTREGVDNPNFPREQLVQSYVLAAKAQSDYVEAVFKYVLALAALERVTAGGVRPDFPER